jgi:hypothetical protein
MLVVAGRLDRHSKTASTLLIALLFLPVFLLLPLLHVLDTAHSSVYDPNTTPAGVNATPATPDHPSAAVQLR